MINSVLWTVISLHPYMTWQSSKTPVKIYLLLKDRQTLWENVSGLRYLTINVLISTTLSAPHYKAE